VKYEVHLGLNDIQNFSSSLTENSTSPLQEPTSNPLCREVVTVYSEKDGRPISMLRGRNGYIDVTVVNHCSLTDKEGSSARGLAVSPEVQGYSLARKPKHSSITF
jgi:hypothetical protein